MLPTSSAEGRAPTVVRYEKAARSPTALIDASAMSRAICEAYYASREALGFPMVESVADSSAGGSS